MSTYSNNAAKLLCMRLRRWLWRIRYLGDRGDDADADANVNMDVILRGDNKEKWEYCTDTMVFILSASR